MITIFLYVLIEKLTGWKGKDRNYLEWGSEPQLHLHMPEHPRMNWHGTGIQQTQNLMQCWWRGWLRAGTPRAAAQVAGTQAQQFLKEGGSDERQQGFISSCVLPWCRMIRQSSLSRFPSHPLSCLFGAQTFCNIGCTMGDSPCTSGI